MKEKREEARQFQLTVEMSEIVSENLYLKQWTRSVAHGGISDTQMLNSYRKRADTYNQEVMSGSYCGHTLTAKYMCESYPQVVRTHIRILDVGAGTGLVGEELKKAGFTNIDGLDPCEAMLDKAREKGLYKQYLVEFLTEKQLDIPDNAYDGLCGSGIYMEGGHVPVSALREMIRLVKQGGYIVLVARTNLLNQPPYNDLEPMMDRLEREGKWKKVDRIVGPNNLYLDKVAITWHYQVV